MKYIKLFEEYTQEDYIQSEYEFAYNCISPTDGNELEAIINDMSNKEVDAITFLKIIPFSVINEYLPVVYSNEQQMIKDYAIRFYIGSFYYDKYEESNREYAIENDDEYSIEDEGELIEYAVVVNSAIEHVWKK